jgi:Flp pilus assembly protein TadB
VKQRATRFRVITHVLLGFALLLLGILPQAASHAAKAVKPKQQPRLDVIAVIDSSARNYDKTLANARRALATYVRSLPTGIRVGLVSFGQFPTVIRDLSTSKDGAVAALSQISAQGDQRFYDGLNLASEQFSAGLAIKRQIVVVSDGSDIGSTTRLEDVSSTLAVQGIRVDVLTFNSFDENPTALQALTSRTGGAVIPMNDSAALNDLSARSVEWSRPPAPPEIPKPSFYAKLLSSPIFLGVGLLLVFGALAAVMMMLTAPKPKGVDLVNAPVFTFDEKKAAPTAMAGIADRLATVADKAIEKQGKTGGLNVSLERAGINLRPGEFVVMCIGAAVVATVIGFVFRGFPGAGGFAFVVGVLGPRMFLKRKAKKRSAAFGEQLSDTLQLLSSSLRAGQGLMQAVDSVAREGDAPASEEFRRVVVESRLGRDLVESLKSMSARLGSEDFQWVIPAIEINREVGGDLAEVLDTVATTVRDRADIRRQVKTLSAEGKMSAYVLLALPIVIALMVRASNPAYIEELFHGTGLIVAGIGVLLMVIGGFWLFKLCKIEF